MKNENIMSNYLFRNEHEIYYEERTIIVGHLSHQVSKEVIELVCRTNNRFNGLLMWELQMVQNFDKVVKFDSDVQYYNIRIQLGVDFWVKIVKLSKCCIIFTNSEKR